MSQPKFIIYIFWVNRNLLFTFFESTDKHLNSNQIEQIETNGFQGLDNLEELNLSENKLTKIDSNSFQHFNNLKKLDLKENQIEQIDLNGFRRLKNLKIEGIETKKNCNIL